MMNAHTAPPLRGRLHPGAAFPRQQLVPIAGPPLSIPDPDHIVHLQLRRFAGCPICNLHLRTFVRRKVELETARVREVIVFHSSASDLQRVFAEYPFQVVPDPHRRLYKELGVGSSPRAMLDPRAMGAAIRATAARVSRHPTAGVSAGILGLPGDFLVAPSGLLLAVKYGVHADDQWSVDDVLSLAAQAAAS